MIHVFSKTVCSLLTALLASLWKAETKNIVPGQIGFLSARAARGTWSKDALSRARGSVGNSRWEPLCVENKCMFLGKEPVGFPAGCALAVSLEGRMPPELPPNSPAPKLGQGSWGRVGPGLAAGTWPHHPAVPRPPAASRAAQWQAGTLCPCMSCHRTAWGPAYSR